MKNHARPQRLQPLTTPMLARVMLDPRASTVTLPTLAHRKEAHFLAPLAATASISRGAGPNRGAAHWPHHAAPAQRPAQRTSAGAAQKHWHKRRLHRRRSYSYPALRKSGIAFHLGKSLAIPSGFAINQSSFFKVKHLRSLLFGSFVLALRKHGSQLGFGQAVLVSVFAPSSHPSIWQARRLSAPTRRFRRAQVALKATQCEPIAGPSCRSVGGVQMTHAQN